ncbi:hypothetical protein A0256_14335 [Mucilaginibacter sp. PAMC 26640]|nr:hypothetical protein A0256_14335 [Mucilaginibacter sp. PAMC 26640]
MSLIPSKRKLKNDHIVVQTGKIKDKSHQSAIITSLLMDEETWWCQPQTEWHIDCDGKDYRIDLWYDDLKLAVEIDELHYNTAQSEKDDPEREKSIVKKMACEFLRFKIDDPGFIHADAVKKIKVRMNELRAKNLGLKEWDPQHFTPDQVFVEHQNIVFVKGDEKNPFPNFKLANQFLGINDLTVVLLRESVTGYADKLLKQVDQVIKVEHMESAGNGYVSWCGSTINHPVMSSGQTSVSLIGGAMHNLKKK